MTLREEPALRLDQAPKKTASLKRMLMMMVVLEVGRQKFLPIQKYAFVPK
ncbi:hypothetical protein O9993_21470 [Vibrio lentus]|nr:hypothetical protein [Vibrio lentus]